MLLRFAQISMSLIDLGKTDVPVLTIGTSGFNKIRDIMVNKPVLI